MAVLETRFIVEMLIGDDWENVWHEDGEPASFDTAEIAQMEIDAHIRDCIEAVEGGQMEDHPDPSEFRVTAVQLPNPYAVQTARRHNEWREAVELATSGKVSELAVREDFAPKTVFGALCYALQYSHHSDKTAKGYITPAQARAVLYALGADEPEAAENLLSFMEPHWVKPEGKARYWPINGGHDQAAANKAWGMVHGIERGWFAYDRAGFLHWSEAGRDRYAAGTAHVVIESATGQVAFAF